MTQRIPLQIGPAQSQFPRDIGWRKKKLLFRELLFGVFFWGGVGIMSALRDTSKNLKKRFSRD
ncbi:MAG: hypothetical protein WD509_01155 [Candidatus Paceibacterota bacterium]